MMTLVRVKETVSSKEFICMGIRDKDREDKAWYTVVFLSEFQKKNGIPLDKWAETVEKYKLATKIYDEFYDIQEMQPEQYTMLLGEYLKNIGVDICNV